MVNYKIKTSGADEKSSNISQAISAYHQEEREKEIALRAKQNDLGYVNLKTTPINSDTLMLIPHKEADLARVVAFLQVGMKLRIALEDPNNPHTQAIIEKLKNEGYGLNISLASAESIDHALSMYQENAKTHVDQIETEIDEDKLDSYAEEINKLRENAKNLSKMTSSEALSLILVGAVKSGASDVHFQSEEGRVDVFFRIDGVLQNIFTMNYQTYDLLRGQMKHDARVKINVTNIPQDGDLSFRLNDRRIDVRLSTLPTQFGESVVLRLLDAKDAQVSFDALGFDEEEMQIFERILKLPYGMVLATGPTGSGKTTTLYSLLNKFHTPGKKIITLEDPVEYHLEGVTQSEINEEEGFTFASGLRAVLRQDPDIIMVGEIRDNATANAAVQAALTGHIVLSTLHTNTAVEAIPRMLNLDVQEFLLAPATSVIIAQRLVRKVCPHCAVETPLTDAERNQIQNIINQMPEANRKRMPQIPNTILRAKGCKECSQTGYKGRTVVSEILELDAEVRKMILENKNSDEILAYVRGQGMLTLRESALHKVLTKQTTLSELIRVTGI